MIILLNADIQLHINISILCSFISGFRDRDLNLVQWLCIKRKLIALTFNQTIDFMLVFCKCISCRSFIQTNVTRICNYENKTIWSNSPSHPFKMWVCDEDCFWTGTLCSAMFMWIWIWHKTISSLNKHNREIQRYFQLMNNKYFTQSVLLNVKKPHFFSFASTGLKIGLFFIFLKLTSRRYSHPKPNFLRTCF